jgi:hypothetical protein
MFLVRLPIVAVVERDFLAGPNVAQSRDPNPPLLAISLAIRRAAMIDKPRRVPVEITVQIKLIVKRKNAPILPLATPGGFRLGYFFPKIFDHPLAPFQRGCRENALAMNGGGADAEAVAHCRGS